MDEMERSELLFEGPIGGLRAEEVLQFAAQTGGRSRVSFEGTDRATGMPRAVDLVLDEGQLVGLGPRGLGLRLGDLAVARGVISRSALEEIARTPGPRLGERLVERGVLAVESLEDLLWERHARVVWSVLTWDTGCFRVSAATPEETHYDASQAAVVPVTPPIALAGLLLDGLQRAESALHDEQS
jgi:hypothetical protein